MLIGLHGRAGSGKDTCYEFLRDWADSHHHPVRRTAFADKLKVSAAHALGFSGSDQECIALGNQLKAGWEIIARAPSGIEHPLSGREFLQLYGTEAHRDIFGEDFWIDHALKDYNLIELLVVTDVRLPNEAEAIRNLDGEVWHVVRPFHCGISQSHVTEQQLSDDLIDRTVINDGSLDLLHRRVNDTIYEMENKWQPMMS